MVSEKVTVHSPQGLHLRPAGDLAEFALRYRSNIWLEFGDKQVSAKSLLGVLSLCIRQNTELNVVCQGSDEEEALAGMVDFISHLGVEAQA